MSLNVYRSLRGRFTLIELTYMWDNNDISLMYCAKTEKLTGVFENEYGSQLYSRKKMETSPIGKPKSPYGGTNVGLDKFKDLNQKIEEEKAQIIPVKIDDEYYKLNMRTGEYIPQAISKPMKYMSNQTLYENWANFNFEKQNLQQYAMYQNELISRGLLSEYDKINPNDYNDEIFESSNRHKNDNLINDEFEMIEITLDEDYPTSFNCGEFDMYEDIEDILARNGVVDNGSDDFYDEISF